MCNLKRIRVSLREGWGLDTQNKFVICNTVRVLTTSKNIEKKSFNLSHSADKSEQSAVSLKEPLNRP